MTKHADRDHSEPYWPPTATREPRVRFPLDDGDTGASLLPVAPAGTLLRCPVQPDLQVEVERLTIERDRAREECGHEKAMRASQRDEMMRYFGHMRTAEATVDRVENLAAYLDTLAPGDRHYAARIRAALAGTP